MDKVVASAAEAVADVASGYLNDGSVTNTAKASAGEINSNEDKATVTVTPPPPPPPPPPLRHPRWLRRPRSTCRSRRRTPRSGERRREPDVHAHDPQQRAGYGDQRPRGRLAPGDHEVRLLTTNQGTCTGGHIVRCSIGRGPERRPGDNHDRRAAPEAGSILNIATVVGDQIETNTANNSASAPTLVVGRSHRRRSCPTLTCSPGLSRSASADREGLVVDKNRGVSGVRILVRAPASSRPRSRTAADGSPSSAAAHRHRQDPDDEPARSVLARRIGVVGVFLPPPVTG